MSKNKNPFSPKNDPFFCPDPVLKLTRDNFYPFVGNNDLVLVMFYEPCNTKSVESKTELIPREMKGWDKIQYACVNCTEEKIICSRELGCGMNAIKLYADGFSFGELQEPPRVNIDAFKKLLKSASKRSKGCACY